MGPGGQEFPLGTILAQLGPSQACHAGPEKARSAFFGLRYRMFSYKDILVVSRSNMEDIGRGKKRSDREPNGL